MTKQEMIDIMRGKTQYTGKRWQQLNDVQKDFDEIADYLENAEIVIRCKDCRYAREPQRNCREEAVACEGVLVCENGADTVFEDEIGWKFVTDDWYCADGERKGGEQDEVD